MLLLSVERKADASLGASAHGQSPSGSPAPIVFPMRFRFHAQAAAKNQPLPVSLIVSGGSTAPWMLLFVKWSSKTRKKWSWFLIHFYDSIVLWEERLLLVERPGRPPKRSIGGRGEATRKEKGGLMARIDGVNPEEVDEYTRKV